MTGLTHRKQTCQQVTLTKRKNAVPAFRRGVHSCEAYCAGFFTRAVKVTHRSPAVACYCMLLVAAAATPLL